MRRAVPAVFVCVLGLALFVAFAPQLFRAGEGRRKTTLEPAGPTRSPVGGHINPTDGSELIWIPGGEFTMGSDEGDADEKPPHKVVVEGFWLGRFEVTNAQYAAFLKATNESEPMYWNMEGYKDPEQPVVGVTWQEAKAYADWAGLRLPTEAEWECAARGGRQLRYATETGAISHDLANYQGTTGKDRWDGPAPVGSFPPNPFGLHDMAGNAWEWTSTLYEPYPHSKEDDREDTDSSYGMRVMRGGSWHFSAPYTTTTYRRRFSSHLEYDYAGIRVALTKGPATPPAEAETGAEKVE